MLSRRSVSPLTPVRAPRYVPPGTQVYVSPYILHRDPRASSPQPQTCSFPRAGSLPGSVCLWGTSLTGLHASRSRTGLRTAWGGSSRAWGCAWSCVCSCRRSTLRSRRGLIRMGGWGWFTTIWCRPGTTDVEGDGASGDVTVSVLRGTGLSLSETGLSSFSRVSDAISVIPLAYR